MGLGSTAQKIQAMADRAEQLYTQIKELREQIAELRTTVEATGDQVDELAIRSEKQWAIVQAIAEAQDVDVEEILTEAAIEEVDPDSADLAEPDEESSEE